MSGWIILYVRSFFLNRIIKSHYLDMGVLKKCMRWKFSKVFLIHGNQLYLTSARSFDHSAKIYIVEAIKSLPS